MLHRWKGLHETVEIGLHRLHTGLLEHYLRYPHPVGRRLLPPWKDTAVPLVPGKKRAADGRKTFFPVKGGVLPLQYLQFLINVIHVYPLIQQKKVAPQIF